MNEQAGKSEESCPRAEIAAYIDCELSPRAELLLEEHLAACEICRAELNEQKKLLSALDFALEEKRSEIEIPKDFAKVVATRAESSVSGLRSPKERGRAVFLCVSLFFIVLVGLGAEAEKVFAAAGVAFEKTVALVSFLGHLTFDAAFGIVVILRALFNQSSVNAILLTGFLLGALVAAFFALPRFLGRGSNRQRI
jgi:anti-sigma factor RsiW